MGLILWIAGLGGCHPSGNGQLEVVHPEYFNPSTDREFEDWKYRVSPGAWPVEITAGDHFDPHPRPDGKFTLDLRLTFKYHGLTTTLGAPGGWTCERLPGGDVRCRSGQMSGSILYGPTENVVVFRDETIASLRIIELEPGSAETARRQIDGLPVMEGYPRDIARFTDGDILNSVIEKGAPRPEAARVSGRRSPPGRPCDDCSGGRRRVEAGGTTQGS